MNPARFPRKKTEPGRRSCETGSRLAGSLRSVRIVFREKCLHQPSDLVSCIVNKLK